ncbi:MAG: SGNH/GDSL hydrolase family protein [Verrucomicrobiota bacterium]|nr:SGNH/GDSL hydrolase family protein [Limisphaera sp.]MDW8380852.1 SGNH/GDSL hydrolase family protein [Verrucomicrobiota bacterium]
MMTNWRDRLWLVNCSARRGLVAALLVASLFPAPGQETNPQRPGSHRAPTAEMLPGKGPVQGGDWFDKVWSQRRAEFRARRALDRGAIVFLGDSITQGWTDVEQRFPDWKCANRGISGDTTRGILFRLHEDVLDLAPAAVVLLIGTNDIGLGGEPEDVADNLCMILQEFQKANPAMPVVLCKVMPSHASRQRPAEKIRRLNSLMAALAQRFPQCHLCDTWTPFADADGNARVEEFPDFLHPNAAGYAKWAAVLEPILRGLPRLPRAASDGGT